jgi:type IV secretory pathway VirB2 component (pilin)
VNCYNHPDRPAVGTCKGCCKGLCADCSSDLGLGLACRGVHESHVASVNALIERNIERGGSTAKRGVATGISMAVLGTLGIAMIVSSARSDLDNFLEYVGGAALTFLAAAYFWRLITGRKADQIDRPNA